MLCPDTIIDCVSVCLLRMFCTIIDIACCPTNVFGALIPSPRTHIVTPLPPPPGDPTPLPTHTRYNMNLVVTRNRGLTCLLAKELLIMGKQLRPYSCNVPCSSAQKELNPMLSRLVVKIDKLIRYSLSVSR